MDFVIFVCMTIVLFALPPTLGQVFLGEDGFDPVSVEFPDYLSTPCQAALNDTVNCNSSLVDIAFNGLFPSDDDLECLCTQNCKDSLDTFRGRQLSACSPTDVISSGGVSYPATLSVDQLIFTFNYTCRKDRESEQFCAPQVAKWQNGTLTSQQNCSDCLLGTYESELNSYFGYDADFAAEFSSLTSSCEKTEYTITSPAPYTIHDNATATSTVPLPSASCTDSYTVSVSDDCNSISKAHNVSTFSLLYENKLKAHCVDFPEPGEKLCLPKQCDIYTVELNDTCYSIMKAHNYAFTMTQLISWNTNINRGCSNLEQYVGTQICISMPGDTSANDPKSTGPSTSKVTTAAPIPTNVMNGTNTYCAKYYQVAPGDTCASLTVMMGIGLQDFYFLNPEINSTTCYNLEAGRSYCVKAVGHIRSYSGYRGATSRDPCIYGTSFPSSCYATSVRTDTYWSFPAVATTSKFTDPATLPLAPGTCEKCRRYTTYFEPVVKRNTTYTDPNSCSYIAYFRDITIDQFVLWNPSLSYNQSDPTACVISKGYRYCVATIGGAPSTSAAISTTTTPSKTTSVSATIPSSSDTTTPSPIQPGMTKSCVSFYFAKTGDTCYDIAQNNTVALEDFYAWNPAVKNDCSALLPDNYVCIGVKGPTTSTQLGSTTTTSTPAVTAPGPTRTGTVSDCGKFHERTDDETCYSIAQDAGITLDQFYIWNPAVGTDCSDLESGYYYCIGLR